MSGQLGSKRLFSFSCQKFADKKENGSMVCFRGGGMRARGATDREEEVCLCNRQLESPGYLASTRAFGQWLQCALHYPHHRW